MLNKTKPTVNAPLCHVVPFYMLALVFLLMPLTASHASDEDELGIVNQSGLSSEEALIRARGLVKKYDNAKAELGRAIGINPNVSEEPQKAKEPERLAEAPPNASNANTSKLILKNGRSMDVVIESKDPTGMWVSMGSPDTRFYVRNDELKEIVHKMSDIG